MKSHNKLAVSVILVLVFLSCTIILAKLNGVAYRDKVKKEEAFSQDIFVNSIGVSQRDTATKKEVVRRITEYLRSENIALQDKKLRIISEMVYRESMRHNIDYRLVLALMKIESNFRHDAVSEKGARGLLQVKPSVAKFVAEDVGIRWEGDETLDQPKENIRIGIHVFSKLIGDFQSITMALHAYHVGPTRLRELLAEEKVPEKRYLNLVLNEYDRNITILPEPGRQ